MANQPPHGPKPDEDEDLEEEDSSHDTLPGIPIDLDDPSQKTFRVRPGVGPAHPPERASIPVRRERPAPAPAPEQEEPADYYPLPPEATAGPTDRYAGRLGDDQDESSVSNRLGRPLPIKDKPPRALTQAETKTAETTLDGTKPAEGLDQTDLFRPIDPPVKCHAGNRDPLLYRLAIDQFAVGYNKRYDPELHGELRAHIFALDVMRAMDVFFPHLKGTGIYSLEDACAWVRFKSSVQGWRIVDLLAARRAANQGKPTLALPSSVGVHLIGVARPGKLAPNGHLMLAAATARPCNSQTPMEAFGVTTAIYAIHD